ncbi:MAG: phosphate ABC transporter permease subunit PstC [Proteobacteria bacterium]|nr:phosphate ABC transporter permease subunit PstC [Pseudomonadota bacterium]
MESPLKTPHRALDSQTLTRPGSGIKTTQWQHHIDVIFRGCTWGVASLMLIITIGMVIVFAHSSVPSFKKFGLHFLVNSEWNPITENFGALSAISGTMVTALMAMLISVPISLGISFFLTEICPIFLRPTLRIIIELLAGIPSIIYGMWGLFVLAPLLSDHIQPWLSLHLSSLYLVGLLFQGAPLGMGILAASLVLSIMVVPFISSVMRDAFEIVPDLLKESAYGLGATRWEVFKNIILPYCRNSLIGGIILGLGRAIGETMAVAFVIGNSHQIFTSLFMPATTISSTLANEYSEATGKIYISSLNELGVILFMITILIFSCSRIFIQYAKRKG